MSGLKRPFEMVLRKVGVGVAGQDREEREVTNVHEVYLFLKNSTDWQ